MTARLVALMSFVLLLSLAAFAFLVSRAQAEVMGEVTRAVSDAGRATLLQFEALGSPQGHSEHQIIIAMKEKAEGRLECVGSACPEPSPGTVGTASTASPAGSASAIAHWVGTSEGSATGTRRIEQRVEVFSSEDVRADQSSAAFVVLRVPAPLPGAVVDKPLGDAEVTAAAIAPRNSAALAPASGVGTITTRRFEKEIRLPLPVRDFQARFADLRRRSLWVFLAVFAVGTLLSAALAHRFTRPVRELDHGLRRLAEGDLGVRVETPRKDEVGRLAAAFNEVARKLRLGRERERELARRDKLSALGRLAAGVAHDVRNPLHSIGLILQHLETSCAPGEPARAREQSRLVSLIRDEIHRLDRLVENFLRFARSERRSPQPTDLVALVRETEGLVEREARRRGVEVRVEAEEGVPAVEADAESVRSAVLNLVLNAFEAMPEGGTLVLRVRRAEDAVEVAVADSGCGIPEAEQERVFEFAYTTREGGSGLGLAMVHQSVVEDHGGRVLLESRPGHGTHVRLLLPLPRALGGAPA